MSIELMTQIWKIKKPHLSAYEKLVLLKMADHGNNEGKSIYPGLTYLADSTSTSRRGVIKIINSLIEKKFIRKTRSGNPKINSTNHYSIDVALITNLANQPKASVDKSIKKSAPLVNTIHHPSEHHSPPPSERGAPKPSITTVIETHTAREASKEPPPDTIVAPNGVCVYLKSLGLNDSQIEWTITRYGSDYVQEKIELTKSKDDLDNPIAFFKKALKEDWKPIVKTSAHTPNPTSAPAEIKPPRTKNELAEIFSKLDDQQKKKLYEICRISHCLFDNITLEEFFSADYVGKITYGVALDIMRDKFL